MIARLAAVAVVTLLAAACASARETDLALGFPEACAGGEAGPLIGDWRLAAFDGEQLRFMQITLDVEERGFGGTMVCNGYGTGGEAELDSHYGLADGALMLAGEVVRTTRYCGDPRLMVVEAAYLDVLRSQPQVRRTGDRLCLLTGDGRSLEFARTGGGS